MGCEAAEVIFNSKKLLDRAPPLLKAQGATRVGLGGLELLELGFAQVFFRLSGGCKESGLEVRERGR